MKKEFKNIKLLYVEDEEKIRKNAISYFKRLFDHVYDAENGYDALDIVKNNKPHIIISDIKMPKLSGIDFIKKVREYDSKVQIIILTAFTDTNYLLSAIELGLIKYLIKPIRHDIIFPVLLQCAKNINNNETNLKYIAENCVFDTFNKTLVYENEIIKLSKNELTFLNLLCSNNRVVTYEEIENVIWYDSYMSEDAIRSLVRNLRRKLPKNTLNNISKIGYRITCI